jgi:hypothetical protein
VKALDDGLYLGEVLIEWLAFAADLDGDVASIPLQEIEALLESGESHMVERGNAVSNDEGNNG